MRTKSIILKLSTQPVLRSANLPTSFQELSNLSKDLNGPKISLLLVDIGLAYDHLGGKDGVPFPVDRQAMDRSIQLLRQGIEEAKLGKKQTLKALERLSDFMKRVDSPNDMSD